MLYPSINEIKHKADSRYTLVILAAKRARDIIDGKPPLVDCKVNRPVSIAAREINEDMIKVHYPEDKPAETEEESEAAAEGEETEAEEAEETDAADAEAADDAADEVESGDAEAASEEQAEEE